MCDLSIDLDYLWSRLKLVARVPKGRRYRGTRLVENPSAVVLELFDLEVECVGAGLK